MDSLPLLKKTPYVLPTQCNYEFHMDHTINNDDPPPLDSIKLLAFVMEPPLLFCAAVVSFLILFHERQRIKRISAEKVKFLLSVFAVPLNTPAQYSSTTAQQQPTYPTISTKEIRYRITTFQVKTKEY